jgi:hypothetical protein
MGNGYLDYLRFKFSGDNEIAYSCESSLIRSKHFLKSIGRVLNLDPYHKKVVHAYVIGDEIWDNKDFKEAVRGIFINEINKIARTEKEKIIVEAYKKNLPENVPLIHLLHVICMNYPVSYANYCKASLARIIEKRDRDYLAEYNKLEFDRERFYFEQSKAILKPPPSNIVNGIYLLPLEFEEGDYVIAHRDNIVWKADDKEIKNYEKYSNQILKRVNKLWQSQD